MCAKTIMKKILLLLCLTLTCISSSARDVNVISGDASVVMNIDNSAVIEFDYSNLEIDGIPYEKWLRSKGRDYVRGWDSESQYAEKGFIDNWNDENETGMFIATTDDEKNAAQYRIVVSFTSLSYGSITKKIITGIGGRAKGSGTIKVFKKGSDEALLIVEFKDERGGNQYKWAKKQMRKAVYSNLGKETVEVIQEYYKKNNKNR